jgi:hypothetical protein
MLYVARQNAGLSSHTGAISSSLLAVARPDHPILARSRARRHRIASLRTAHLTEAETELFRHRLHTKWKDCKGLALQIDSRHVIQ